MFNGNNNGHSAIDTILALNELQNMMKNGNNNLYSTPIEHDIGYSPSQPTHRQLMDESLQKYGLSEGGLVDMITPMGGGIKNLTKILNITGKMRNTENLNRMLKHSNKKPQISSIMDLLHAFRNESIKTNPFIKTPK